MTDCADLRPLNERREQQAWVESFPAITIFSASGERQVLPPYVDVHRLFARGEAMTLCKAALASGPMNTRQLALHVMKAKGLDTGDRVLAKAVASRLIHALRQQARRGLIDGSQKDRGIRIWKLFTPRWT